MKKILILMSLLAVCFALPVWADKNDDVDPDYDIVQTGVGTPGTCLVQVSCYSKRGKVSDDHFRQTAVHGVIFRGVAAASAKERLPQLHPLVPAAQEKDKAAFFKDFFDNQYMNYVSIVPGTYSRMKTAKRGYRVSCVLQVSRDELRRALEKAGVARGLSSGF